MSSSSPEDLGRLSASELITIMLSEPYEDHSRDAIAALQRRGDREVFDQAAALCTSPCSLERMAGAAILGQLGTPERTFPDECRRALKAVLETEDDPGVLTATLFALSWQTHPEGPRLALPFRGHPSPDVRKGVAFLLTGSVEPAAVAALIELSRDPDEPTRDWATFALGSQISLDTPGIREALAQRLEDGELIIRCEAMIGLGLRHDERAVPAIQAELESGSNEPKLIEAATYAGDSRLLPALHALAASSEMEREELDDAIKACSAAGPAAV